MLMQLVIKNLMLTMSHTHNIMSQVGKALACEYKMLSDLVLDTQTSVI